MPTLTDADIEKLSGGGQKPLTDADIAASSNPTAVSPPTGFLEREFPNMTTGAKQVGHAFSADEPWQDRASDVVEGAGKFLMPVAVGAGLADPLTAIPALVGGVGGNAIGRVAASTFGASPETERLVGNAGAIAGGAGGGMLGNRLNAIPGENWLKAGEKLPYPIGGFVRAGRTLFARPPESVPEVAPSLIERPSGVTTGRPIMPSPESAAGPIPSEPGPGFSGTPLGVITGRGGNPQTPRVALTMQRPGVPEYGGGNPAEYVASGGNQFRIPTERPAAAPSGPVAPPPVESAPVQPSGALRIGQTPAERIQALSQSPEGTVGTRAEMMRQLRLADQSGASAPEKAAIIRRFEAPEYTPRERQYIDPRESQVIAPLK